MQYFEGRLKKKHKNTGKKIKFNNILINLDCHIYYQAAVFLYNAGRLANFRRTVHSATWRICQRNITYVAVMWHVQTSTWLGSLWHLRHTHLSHLAALTVSFSWRILLPLPLLKIFLARFTLGRASSWHWRWRTKQNLWSRRFRIHFLWPACVSRQTLPFLCCSVQLLWKYFVSSSPGERGLYLCITHTSTHAWAARKPFLQPWWEGGWKMC